MIRYVSETCFDGIYTEPSEDRFDDIEPDVYADFSQSGHYRVFTRDGLSLSGFGKDVELFDVWRVDDDFYQDIYRVTHAGIKALGEKYDVSIFVSSDMLEYRDKWERLKDLPVHEDYARTWFEHIPTKLKRRIGLEIRQEIRRGVEEYIDLMKRGVYIDTMQCGICLEMYYYKIFGVRPIGFYFGGDKRTC